MPILRVLYALLLAVAAVIPANAADKIEKLVTVTGEATVAAVPDTAMIRVGVTSQGKTAKAASEANAKDMNAVLAAIRENDIAERDIQTSGLSLQPQYDSRQGGSNRLTGFQMSNRITVKLRDISKLPAVLDRAVGAGANEMSGIEFIVSEESKALDQARSGAVADARRKAELYAGAAGMKVGRVMVILEEGAIPPPRLSAPMRVGAPAATPISPGEQTLRAVVTVTFELTS